jgi:DNA-binding protein HU-beta
VLIAIARDPIIGKGNQWFRFGAVLADALRAESAAGASRRLQSFARIRSVPRRNLGVLQVRIRPARPARKGRNPATGEEIQIKASKASKKVAFRVAKGLTEAI